MSLGFRMGVGICELLEETVLTVLSLCTPRSERMRLVVKNCTYVYRTW
jgi:hypothetical protein